MTNFTDRERQIAAIHIRAWPDINAEQFGEILLRNGCRILADAMQRFDDHITRGIKARNAIALCRGIVVTIGITDRDPLFPAEINITIGSALAIKRDWRIAITHIGLEHQLTAGRILDVNAQNLLHRGIRRGHIIGWNTGDCRSDNIPSDIEACDHNAGIWHCIAGVSEEGFWACEGNAVAYRDRTVG